jgi:hypothetical protein
MKKIVFWEVTPCGSCTNRRFGESSFSIIRMTRIGELETTLAVTSNTSHAEEDGILHRHYHENIKSYIVLTDWAL